MLGLSVTTKPVVSEFSFNMKSEGKEERVRFCLIDTPGFSATNDDRDVDEKNLKEIIEFVHHNYNCNNAVCVVLPSTECRIDSGFKECLTKALAGLSVNLKQNIFFCVTSSNVQNYQTCEFHL